MTLLGMRGGIPIIYKKTLVPRCILVSDYMSIEKEFVAEIQSGAVCTDDIEVLSSQIWGLS